MTINGIPSTEKVWLTCRVSDTERFYFTCKQKNRDMYYLYKQTDGKAEKIAKHANPNVLHDKYVQPRYDALNAKGR